MAMLRELAEAESLSASEWVRYQVRSAYKAKYGDKAPRIVDW